MPQRLAVRRNRIVSTHAIEGTSVDSTLSQPGAQLVTASGVTGVSQGQDVSEATAGRVSHGSSDGAGLALQAPGSDNQRLGCRSLTAKSNG